MLQNGEEIEEGANKANMTRKVIYMEQFAFFVEEYPPRKKKRLHAESQKKKMSRTRLKLAGIYRRYIPAPRPKSRDCWRVFATTHWKTLRVLARDAADNHATYDQTRLGIWSINRVRVSMSGTLRRFPAMFYEQSCVIATVAPEPSLTSVRTYHVTVFHDRVS